jgi:antitoxin MazE
MYVRGAIMTKKLTRTGNSLAIVLEKGLLERTGIDAETPLEVSTDGEVIVISPVRAAKRTAKLRRVMEMAHSRYAGAFKRLAE